MGYGQYVGRVGALAVALGIGSAVAGGYGIAHAEEPGGDSENTTSNTETDNPNPAPEGTEDNALNTAGSAGPNRGPVFHRPFTKLEGARDDDIVHRVRTNLRSALANHPRLQPTDADTQSTQGAPDQKTESGTVDPQSAKSPRNSTLSALEAAGITDNRPAIREAVQPLQRRPLLARVLDATPDATATAHTPWRRGAEAGVPEALHDTVATVLSATTRLRDTTPRTALLAPNPPSGASTPTETITGVLANIGLTGPGATGSPISPVDNPILLSVLAWARRNLFNGSPGVSYDAGGTSQRAGVITGEVVGSDPDGDVVTYRVVDGPDHGTLTVDANTGAFTYVRAGNETATTADDYVGPDEFTVAVSDGAPQFRGLFGLFGSERPATQTVHLDVAPDPIPTTAAVFTNDNRPHFYVAPDGRVFEVSYDTTTKTTSIRGATNGVITTPELSARGEPVGAPVFAANGDVYQTLVRDSTDALEPQQTVVIQIINTSGIRAFSYYDGAPVGGVVLNPADGHYYQTTTPTGGYGPYTRISDVDTESPSLYAPLGADEPVVFDTNGNAYITTSSSRSSYLSYIPRQADGTYGPYKVLNLPGETQGPVVTDPDTGLAYWRVTDTYTDAADNELFQTTVLAIDPATIDDIPEISVDTANPGLRSQLDIDGFATYPAPGNAEGTAILSGGTYYHTTASTLPNGDPATIVTILRPGDPDYAREITLPGRTSTGPVPAPDGTGVYQLAQTTTNDTTTTTITLIRADGTSTHIADIPGTSPLTDIGPDGTLYVRTTEFNPTTTDFNINIIDPSTGHVTTITTPTGTHGLAIDNTGTAYWAFYDGTTTTITAYNPTTHNTTTTTLTGHPHTVLEPTPTGDVYLVTDLRTPDNHTQYTITTLHTPLPAVAPSSPPAAPPAPPTAQPPVTNPVVARQIPPILSWLHHHFFNGSPGVSYDAGGTSQRAGVITGEVVGSDPDGDVVTYRVVDGPDHGTLTVDANTGAFTYVRAGNETATTADDYVGPDEFTVAVSDGAPQFRGLFGLFGSDRPATQTVHLDVAPDPIPTTAAVFTDDGSARFYLAPDGRVFEDSYDTTTKFTSIRAATNGVITTPEYTVRGEPVGAPVFAANGDVYQTLVRDTDDVSEPYRTVVMRLSAANGPGYSEYSFYDGAPVGGVVLNPADGHYYQTTTPLAGGYGASTRISDVNTESPSLYAPIGADEPVVFDTNGNAYVITNDRFGKATYLSYIPRGADGTYGPYKLLKSPGETEGPVVTDPDTGLAYWRVTDTYTDAADNELFQTTVLVIDPATIDQIPEITVDTAHPGLRTQLDIDGFATYPAPGRAEGTAILNGGTYYHTTASTLPDGDPATVVTTLRPDDPDYAREITLPGRTFTGPVPTPDGTGVYQLTQTTTNTTTVTLIHPDGTSTHIADIPGSDPRTDIGPDGTLYVRTTESSTTDFTLNIIDPTTGHVTTITAPTRTYGFAIDNTGTAYWAFYDGTTNTTTITAYNPTTHNTTTTTLTGFPDTDLRPTLTGDIYLVTRLRTPDSHTEYTITTLHTPTTPLVVFSAPADQSRVPGLVGL